MNAHEREARAWRVLKWLVTRRRRRRNSQRNAGVASAERLLIGRYAPAARPLIVR